MQAGAAGGTGTTRTAGMAAMLILPVVLAVGYLLGVRLSVAFSILLPSAFAWDWWVPIWLPTGLAFAAVMRFGWKAVPGILVGSVANEVLQGSSPAASGVIGFVNATQPLIVMWLLGRQWTTDALFSKVRHVLRFVFAAAVVTAGYSAVLGTGALAFDGLIDGSPVVAWGRWVLGDVSAILVVTPPLYLLLSGKVAVKKATAPESLLAATLGAVVAVVVFSDILSVGPFTSLPASFALFPCLVWSALRCGVFSTAIHVFFVALTATVFTASGHGPFVAAAQPAFAILLLQTLIATLSLTGLLLSSASREREAFQSGLAETLTRLDQLVQVRTRALDTSNRQLAAEVEGHERAARINTGRSRIMERLARGADLDDLLADLVCEARQVRPDWMACISLIDEDGTPAVRALSQPGGETRAPAFDWAVADEAGGAQIAMARMGISSSKGRTLGTITVYSTSAIAIAEEDRSFVQETADLAGIIVEHKETENRLRELARYDSLTGALNRHAFSETVGSVLDDAGAGDRRAAVLYIDLDAFKAMNDTFGHAVGDRLLVEFAGRMRAVIGKRGYLSRFGGDEFAVALPETDEAGAAGVAGEIIDRCVVSDFVDGQRERVTASIGISVFPADGRTFESLLRRADDAMYAAKRAGGERYALSRDCVTAAPQSLAG